MAKKAGTTFEKRRREREKMDKKLEKQKRRELKKLENKTSISGDSDEDPDIAGIIPGPQSIDENDT